MPNIICGTKIDILVLIHTKNRPTQSSNLMRLLWPYYSFSIQYIHQDKGSHSNPKWLMKHWSALISKPSSLGIFLLGSHSAWGTNLSFLPLSYASRALQSLSVTGMFDTSMVTKFFQTMRCLKARTMNHRNSFIVHANTTW